MGYVVTILDLVTVWAVWALDPAPQKNLTAALKQEQLGTHVNFILMLSL